MTLRDDVELALLGTTAGADLATDVGNCVDILLGEGVLKGSESATETIREVILQAIAEGAD